MKSPFNFNLPNDNPGFSQEKLLEFFEKNPDILKKELQKQSLKYKPITKQEFLNIENLKEYLDEEGGIMIEPSPNFVMKCHETNNEKIFFNITDHYIIDEPEEKELIEMENAPSVRIPMSVGQVKEDNDNRGEICKVIDVILNPNIAENIKKDKSSQIFLVQLLESYIFEKHKIKIKTDFTIPKLKYKGKAIEMQRVKGKKNPKIEKIIEKENKFNADNQKNFEDNKENLMSHKNFIVPDFKIFCKYPDYQEEFDGEYDLEKLDSLFLIFDLPLLVTGKNIILEASEEELYLKNGKIYEAIIRFPIKVDPKSYSSIFDLEARQLKFEIRVKNIVKSALKKTKLEGEKGEREEENEIKKHLKCKQQNNNNEVANQLLKSYQMYQPQFPMQNFEDRSTMIFSDTLSYISNEESIHLSPAKISKEKIDIFSPKLNLKDLASIKKIKFPDQKLFVNREEKLKKELYLPQKQIKKGTKNKKFWSEEETNFFYEALTIWGTDFSLMKATMFPNRSENQLKRKYKKEEKRNSNKLKEIFSKEKHLNIFSPDIIKLDENLKDTNFIIEGNSFDLKGVPKIIGECIKNIIIEEKMERRMLSL